MSLRGLGFLLLTVLIEVLKGLIILHLLFLDRLVFLNFIKGESDGLLESILLRVLGGSALGLGLLLHRVAEHLESLLDHLAEIGLVLLSLGSEHALGDIRELLNWVGHLWLLHRIGVAGVGVRGTGAGVGVAGLGSGHHFLVHRHLLGHSLVLDGDLLTLLGVESQRPLDGLLELVLVRHFLSLTMLSPELATSVSSGTAVAVAPATVSPVGTPVLASGTTAHHHSPELSHWASVVAAVVTMASAVSASVASLPELLAALHLVGFELFGFQHHEHLGGLFGADTVLLELLGEELGVLEHPPEEVLVLHDLAPEDLLIGHVLVVKLSLLLLEVLPEGFLLLEDLHELWGVLGVDVELLEHLVKELLVLHHLEEHALVLHHLEPELLLRGHVLPVEIGVVLLPLLPHAAVAFSAFSAELAAFAAEHLLEEFHWAAGLLAVLSLVLSPHLLHVSFLLAPHLFAAHHLVEHLAAVLEHLAHVVWVELLVEVALAREEEVHFDVLALLLLGHFDRLEVLWLLGLGSLAEDLGDLGGDLGDSLLDGVIEVLLEFLLEPSLFLPPFLALAFLAVLVGGGLIAGFGFLFLHCGLLGLGFGGLFGLFERDLDWLGLLAGCLDDDFDGFFALKLLEKDGEVLFAADPDKVVVSVLVLEGEALECLETLGNGLEEVVVAVYGPTDSVDLVVVLQFEQGLLLHLGAGFLVVCNFIYFHYMVSLNPGFP